MGRYRQIVPKLNRRTGIPASTLYNILRGVRRPSREKAEALALATNREADFFLCLTDFEPGQREAALDALDFVPLRVFQEHGGKLATPITAARPKKPSGSASSKSEPPPDDPLKPRKRGDCMGGPRPCIWVSCKWHMWRERRDFKRFILRCENLEVAAAVVLGMRETCTLDLCKTPRPYRQIAPFFGVTHQAVALAGKKALKKLRGPRSDDLRETWELASNGASNRRGDIFAKVWRHLP
jgi:transcriptional regulator with XRE-family HTH domain